MQPRIGVDVGGTFTDVVVVADGVTTAKVPTTDPQHEGVLEGIAVACETAGVDPATVGSLRHATTVAVNALLEGETAETALVTTAGFGDVLAIGRQDRPALYDLAARRPDPLVPAERRHELDERATVEGIERPVDPAEVRALAADIEADAVAVSLLHAYAHPDNERRVAAVLREELDVPVSASHEVLATFREYERTATTAVDAALTPVVDEYLDRLVDGARDRGLPAPRVMQGTGGIADAEAVREHPVTTVMSGPAAGVVGAGTLSAEAVVTFDMGGTSSDVALVREGRARRTTEATVGGHPVRVPMVDVETVGAGGGSIAWVDDGGALRVGPRSAGADPGPACYGKGGTEPTVTDAALACGHLGADTTLGEGLALDADAARAALADLAGSAALDGPLAAARGVLRVATAATTQAVRAVTVERGHDPREFALAAYGGAGPMLAAGLADRLEVQTVLVPRASGVRSAYGLLAADETHDAVRTHRAELGEADPDTVEAIYSALADEVLEEASDRDAAAVHRRADCRYVGQSHEVTVDVDGFDPAAVRERFHAAHERERGYRLDDPVELVSLRATATIESDAPEIAHEGSGERRTGERTVHFDEARETPVFDRRRLPVGWERTGPAVFEGGESTVVCPPGWTVAVDERGTLLLTAEGER